MGQSLFFSWLACCAALCVTTRVKKRMNSTLETVAQSKHAATCKFSGSDYPGWLFHRDWQTKPFELTDPTVHCCCTTTEKYTKDDRESLVVPGANKFVCTAFRKGRRYMAEAKDYANFCKCGDNTVLAEIGNYGWHSPATWHEKWIDSATSEDMHAMEGTCLRLSEALLKREGYGSEPSVQADKMLPALEYSKKFHRWQELLNDKKAVEDRKKVGACQPVETQKGFNLVSFAAKRWYVQQQQPTKYLPMEQNFCVYAEYTVLKKRTFWGYEVQVHNHAEENDGTIHDSGNFLCAHKYSKDDPAKLSVAPCFLPTFAAGPYWVISYNESAGYALVSGGQPSEISPGQGLCRTGSGVNNAGLWIFTRSQHRDERLVQRVRNIATANGFDVGILYDVNQTNCRVTNGVVQAYYVSDEAADGMQTQRA